MRTFVFCILLLPLLLVRVHAQFDAQLSQYMFRPTGFNPAAVGESGMLDVSGQHRLQWIGMPNGGSTTVFNIHSPIKIANFRQGIGVCFINDQVGQFVNQTFHLQYAMKFKIGKGSLSIGPDVGFVSIGIRGDSLRGPHVQIGDYHDIGSDPAIPQGYLDGMGLDLGVGGWLTYDDFYLGASYSHANKPVIEWSETHDFRPASTLYFTSGYSFVSYNEKYKFKPSLLLKTDFIMTHLDLSTIVLFNDQYWGGLSYRWNEAVVFLAGLHVGAGFSIGYSFDLPTSQLIRASWGSHEIMLSYMLDIKTKDSSKRKTYKSVRIL